MALYVMATHARKLISLGYCTGLIQMPPGMADRTVSHVNGIRLPPLRIETEGFTPDYGMQALVGLLISK